MSDMYYNLDPNPIKIETIQGACEKEDILDNSKNMCFFLCDGTACPTCDPTCSHTTDITHAKNFINIEYNYIEQESILDTMMEYIINNMNNLNPVSDDIENI